MKSFQEELLGSLLVNEKSVGSKFIDEEPYKSLHDRTFQMKSLLNQNFPLKNLKKAFSMKILFIKGLSDGFKKSANEETGKVR